MSAIDLPDWFDVENYKWIEECDEHTLFFEWLVRSNLYTNQQSFLGEQQGNITDSTEYQIITGKILEDGCRPHCLTDHMNQIVHLGDGRLFHLMVLDQDGYSISKFLKGNEDKMLPFKRNFTPVSIHDLSRLSPRVEKYEIEPPHLKHHLPISTAIHSNDNKSIYYEINMDATDSQLKEQFEDLLESLRKTKEYYMDKSRVRKDFMWKIKHNNYIPLFDLMIVEKFTQCKFRRKDMIGLVEQYIDNSNFNTKYIKQIKQWAEDAHLLKIQNSLPVVTH